MGKVALSLIASLALTATALSASAAPIAVPEKAGVIASNVITVAGGCGPTFYRNPMGYCIPYTYPAAAYGYPGWYGYPHYAVRYYGHQWHHHHHHHGGHGH